MYGLIGYPLSHSFSKEFFTRKFADERILNEEYLNFPLRDILEFPELIHSRPELKGLNVTIPYKEKIIPFLNELDPISSEIGAVNTIRIESSGKTKFLRGFNTDTYGFRRSLEETITDKLKISRALILGTGGASKAVAYTLKQMNIEFSFVSSSSTTALSYDSLDKDIIRSCGLIVNTSPLGMYPNIMECPVIPYEYLTESHLLFDLIYNPALTSFLKKGQERGAIICNGLKMLEYQALKSWEIWNENY
jgi:shikimate dehydrogenase